MCRSSYFLLMCYYYIISYNDVFYTSLVSVTVYAKNHDLETSSGWGLSHKLSTSHWSEGIAKSTHGVSWRGGGVVEVAFFIAFVINGAFVTRTLESGCHKSSRIEEQIFAFGTHKKNT